MTQVPSQSHFLFWDVNPTTLDLQKNADFILTGVLDYGTMELVRFVREYYGDEFIKNYLLHHGWKVLHKKTINFWKYIFHLENEQCLQPSFLQNNRKFWNY